MSASELEYRNIDTNDPTLPFDPANVFSVQWSQLRDPEVWQGSAEKPTSWRELTLIERAMFDTYAEHGGAYQKRKIDGP